MTLHDCGMALLHPQAANWFLSGKRPVQTGNDHPNLAPYGKYATATCEIFVASGNNGQFRKLCEMIGRPELVDYPRFADNGMRIANRAAMDAELIPIFANVDGYELALRLIRGGVPAGPVLAVDEAVESEHARHREMVAEIGDYRGLNTPVKLSRTPGGARATPPAFGADADDVLRSYGYSDAEIAALRSEGVLLSDRQG